jgi:hypothetical protein
VRSERPRAAGRFAAGTFADASSSSNGAERFELRRFKLSVNLWVVRPFLKTFIHTSHFRSGIFIKKGIFVKARLEKI